MSDHTKGRLVKDYGKTFGHIKVVHDEAKKGLTPTPTLFRYDEGHYAGIPEAEQQANARRLVACWNACEGISTETLEGGGNSRGAVFERNQLALVRDRDELLAALRGYVENEIEDGRARLIRQQQAKSILAKHKERT